MHVCVCMCVRMYVLYVYMYSMNGWMRVRALQYLYIIHESVSECFFQLTAIRAHTIWAVVYNNVFII